MLNKKYIRNNSIAFVALSVLLLFFGVLGVGLAALLIAVINLMAGLLLLLLKQKWNGLTLLLCAGVLLLIGFSVCSAFPLNFAFR